MAGPLTLGPLCTKPVEPTSWPFTSVLLASCQTQLWKSYNWYAQVLTRIQVSFCLSQNFFAMKPAQVAHFSKADPMKLQYCPGISRICYASLQQQRWWHCCHCMHRSKCSTRFQHCWLIWSNWVLIWVFYISMTSAPKESLWTAAPIPPFDLQLLQKQLTLVHGRTHVATWSDEKGENQIWKKNRFSRSNYNRGSSDLGSRTETSCPLPLTRGLIVG